MGFDVLACCRVCLKDAASETAAAINLEHQDLDSLVWDVYGINIKGSRGSKLICLTCYKDAANLKKYLTRHDTTARQVRLNQSLLDSQIDAFPEITEKEDAGPTGTAPNEPVPSPIVSEDRAPDSSLKDPECSTIESNRRPSLLSTQSTPNHPVITPVEGRNGYHPPPSTPEEMLLPIEDCMRSERFRDLLQDKYELAYLLVSGEIYNPTTNEYADVWHPIQYFCTTCLKEFEDSDAIQGHSCRKRCVFCRRFYASLESHNQHACAKRDRHRKSKRKYIMTAIPSNKRARITPTENTTETLEATEPAPADKTIANNTVQVIPMPNQMPAAADAPVVDAEANLDTELSTLLERWYGQGDGEIEEITQINGANLGAEGNGVFTNADLYGRVIDSAIRNKLLASKPSISVKPISQLVDKSVDKTIINLDDNLPSTDVARPADVIEIDDDDDVEIVSSVGGNASATALLPKAIDQQSLSENDILHIVKHFRGIEENESYLVRAKINGVQKLICISKRKGDLSTQEVVDSRVENVNNNSALQANVRNQSAKQILITPTIKQSTIPQNPAMVVTAAPPKPVLQVKKVADINGGVGPDVGYSSSVPQLKIAHVQSLVQQPQHPLAALEASIQTSNGNPAEYRTSIPVFQTKNPPRTGPVPAVKTNVKPAQKQIIVGSNSINKLLNDGKANYVPVKNSTVSVTNTTQKRIIVQRKHVQTIVQSSVSRLTNTDSAITIDDGQPSPPANSLLRTQLMKNPPRVYPSATVTTADGETSQVMTMDGIMTIASAGKPIKINNTIIRRME